MNHNNRFGGLLRSIMRSHQEQDARDNTRQEQEHFDEKKHRAKELRINKIGLIVNSILVTLTLAAIWFTYEQAVISRASLKVASDALQYQKKSDSINGINESWKYELQKKSVQAQIDALNAAKDQFNRQHENFLEIRDLNLEFIDVARNPIIRSTLVCFGSPILIREFKQAFSIGSLYDSVRVKKDALLALSTGEFKSTPVYISEQNARPQENEFDVPLVVFKQTINDPFIFFTVGEIRYTSLINKQKMIMKYLLRTKVINKISYQIVSLSNEKDNFK